LSSPGVLSDYMDMHEQAAEGDQKALGLGPEKALLHDRLVIACGLKTVA